MKGSCKGKDKSHITQWWRALVNKQLNTFSRYCELDCSDLRSVIVIFQYTPSSFTTRRHKFNHLFPCMSWTTSPSTILQNFTSPSPHLLQHKPHHLAGSWFLFDFFLQLGFFKRKRVKDISAPMDESVPMAATNLAWCVTEEQGSTKCNAFLSWQ